MNVGIITGFLLRKWEFPYKSVWVQESLVLRDPELGQWPHEFTNVQVELEKNELTSHDMFSDGVSYP
jgi:hypothetical protein